LTINHGALEGKQIDSSQVSDVFCQQFPAYDEYARWIIDQHLSLVIWPQEYVVQDMHLDFQDAKITPFRCVRSYIQKRLAPRLGNGSRIEDL
jgi:hypothetical protein